MKIVINNCFGGFGLSGVAQARYAELKGIKLYNSATGGCYTTPTFETGSYFDICDVARDDLELIRTVEELGVEANGRYASLKVVEIPYGVNWGISEYDGNEHVAERHNPWC